MFLSEREDFYEDSEDFDYLESLNENTEVSVIHCILCKEPLFLTPPSDDANNILLDKILEYLRRRNLNDKKIIRKIRKLKNKPICRWDLFQMLRRFISKKELSGFFEKIVEFYDFDNVGLKP